MTADLLMGRKEQCGSVQLLVMDDRGMKVIQGNSVVTLNRTELHAVSTAMNMMFGMWRRRDIQIAEGTTSE